MKRSKETERGAILVETALVAGIILTFLLFSIQVGILGFLQVTADAAALVGGRTATLATASPGAYTASLFSQLKPSDVTIAPVPAPTATVPVNYGYNDPLQTNSQYNRHGGYSLIQPQTQSVSVKPSKVISLYGTLATVTGNDTEPVYTECGVHFNVANTSMQCGAAGQPGNYAVNYFSQGENTPPYFVGFDDITHCVATMPWGGTPGTLQNYNGEAKGTCPGASSNANAVNYIGLGIAEFLDYDNWGRTQPGVTTGGAQTATFVAAAYHQACYAKLSAFFTQYPDLIALYQQYGYSVGDQISINKISEMKSWHAFELGPLGAPDATGMNVDLAIRNIYNWDVYVGAPGSPIGTYATHPEVPCV